jgi:hypothetical protein
MRENILGILERVDHEKKENSKRTPKSGHGVVRAGELD